MSSIYGVYHYDITDYRLKEGITHDDWDVEEIHELESFEGFLGDDIEIVISNKEIEGLGIVDVTNLRTPPEIEVVGYYVDPNASPHVVFPEDVFVAFVEVNRGLVEGYCPARGHLAFSSEYLNECREISANVFKRISKGCHIPDDYLVKGKEMNIGLEM